MGHCVDNFKADNPEDNSASLMRPANIIETQLADLVQVLPVPNSRSSSAIFLVLAQTSCLIHNAAKIYFYTALHSALPSLDVVRHLVSDQVNLIGRIPDLRSAHLWTMFVTALYASYDEQRIFEREIRTSRSSISYEQLNSSSKIYCPDCVEEEGFGGRYREGDGAWNE
jgi:hypothetical protein